MVYGRKNIAKLHKSIGYSLSSPSLILPICRFWSYVLTLTGWCFWTFVFFPFSWECHHPN